MENTVQHAKIQEETTQSLPPHEVTFYEKKKKLQANLKKII